MGTIEPMLRRRSRPKWRPPLWIRITLNGLLIVTALLYFFAGVGIVPFGVAFVIVFIVSWSLWASRPEDPGEFR